MKSTKKGLVRNPRADALALKANKIRESMARQGIDRLLAHLQALPDSELVSSVARHVIMKVKLF